MGLVAAGALTTGWGGWRLLAGPAPAVEGLEVLGDRQYQVLAALVATLFAPAGVVQEGQLGDFARVADGYLARLPEPLVQEIGLGLVYVEIAPVLLERSGRTFS